MSPEVKAMFDKLSGDLAATRADLEKSRAEGAAATKVAREKAATAEAKVLIEKLSASSDLRFGKEALDAFSAAYTAAMVGAVSENVELKTFAESQVKLLDSIASGKKPEAPKGEAKPAPIDSSAKLTRADFDGGDSDADARVSAAIEQYIEKNKLTGPGAYMQAFNALAKAAGVSTSGATAGFSAGDVDGDDDE